MNGVYICLDSRHSQVYAFSKEEDDKEGNFSAELDEYRMRLRDSRLAGEGIHFSGKAFQVLEIAMLSFILLCGI